MALEPRAAGTSSQRRTSPGGPHSLESQHFHTTRTPPTVFMSVFPGAGLPLFTPLLPPPLLLVVFTACVLLYVGEGPTCVHDVVVQRIHGEGPLDSIRTLTLLRVPAAKPPRRVVDPSPARRALGLQLAATTPHREPGPGGGAELRRGAETWRGAEARRTATGTTSRQCTSRGGPPLLNLYTGHPA